MTERDPLALAMLAAWMNVRVDQLPPENRAHLNPATMAAWRRVAEAAFAFRDSDSGPEGENSRSEVEGEAPQSGGASRIAQTLPGGSA